MIIPHLPIYHYKGKEAKVRIFSARISTQDSSRSL